MRTEYRDYVGRTVVDERGDKIGDVAEVYEDRETGMPEWASVKSGLFGTTHRLVPVQDAVMRGDQVSVPYSKDHVQAAPEPSGDRRVSTEEEERLYRHYGIGRSTSRSETGLPDDDDDGTRPSMDNLERRSVQLREEELRTRIERVESGAVRLEKDVVTERRSVDVPVTREEVHVERRQVEPRPAGGEDFAEDEIRVPVHEERARVDKQAVVKEEVSIGKRPVQETERVEEDVRREEARVEKEGDPRLRKPEDAEDEA